mmetsp:Transcript_53885/g.60207  ORF Transcript_53885/g.60207 Transcript_53885/m.60207 type:complete len:80 (-) Transcript_53885:507-746(-)
MPIALLLLCLIVPFMIPLAVLLSVRSDVAGCLCASSSAVTQSGTISCAAWYNDSTSASAADATTSFIILAMTMIGLFII